jgi:hypothetical protein
VVRGGGVERYIDSEIQIIPLRVKEMNTQLYDLEKLKHNSIFSHM